MEQEDILLQGRREILSPAERITRGNLVFELGRALGVHAANAAEIDYLWKYMRGQQPILSRKKKVRPEICNKIVENHASEIAQFTSGYFLGEPLTYVRRGTREGSGDEIGQLNSYMSFEDKASHDKDLSMWMAVCGIGYRMVIPQSGAAEEDFDAPFAIDTPDPRTTFVVYNSGFGHRPLMAVRQVWRTMGSTDEDNGDFVCCGYTETDYFEVHNGSILRFEPHSLGSIPIIEYRLNMSRMGSFEPAIPLLNAINSIQSNRCDGLEQFVQSFLKFKNCEIDEEGIKKLREMGAIAVKTVSGIDGDVTIVSDELDQVQTQSLVDYLYDQVLTICGMPTTTKGGASTSDTGAAVFLRDGWSQCEARARDTELLFKKSEKLFLRIVLRILRTVTDFSLSLAEVECKFTRRQHDGLQTKTQALLAMLQAGLHPQVCIATSGLFNDPTDVYEQSRDFLRKWDYVPLAEEESVNTGHTADDGMTDAYDDTEGADDEA